MESSDKVDNSELTKQLFDLAAVAFRGNPNNATFAALLKQTSHGVPFADLTHVTYEVARCEKFKLPSIAYLAKALAMDQRFQEANHFCQLWVNAAPNDNDAQRLAVWIACKRIDLPSARRSFFALQTGGANTGTLWALETIMLLTFWDGRYAEITARHALAAGGDMLIPMVANNAAYRFDDVDLLIDSYVAAPELAEDKGQAAWAQKLLRTRFLLTLQRRGETAWG